MTLREIANKWSANTPGWKWANDPAKYRRNARDVFAFAGIQRGDAVIDIGCGPAFLGRLVEDAGGSYIGTDTDFSPLVCEIREIDSPMVIEHETKRGEALPFVNGWADQWDVILATWITFGATWNRQEWELWIEELKNGLNQDGRIVLVFNEDPISWKIAEPVLRAAGFRGERLRWLYDYWRYDFDAERQGLCGKCGRAVVKPDEFCFVCGKQQNRRLP